MTEARQPVAGRRVVTFMVLVIAIVTVGFVTAVTTNLDTIRRIAEQRDLIIDPYDVPARDVSIFRKATGRSDDGSRVNEEEAKAFCTWAGKRLHRYDQKTGGFRCVRKYIPANQER